MACKKSGFKSYRPLVGPIETQGLCTASATKPQGAHACYILVCTVIPQQYIHKHILSMRTRFAKDAISDGIETKLNTT